MHLTHRLEDRAAADRARALVLRNRRASDRQPLLQLKCTKDFGTQIHRRLVNCRSAGRRPVVLLLAFDTPDGSEPGGELLAAIGARLRSRVRATDVVAQMGERFGVYLDGDVAAHADSIRARLERALAEAFAIGASGLTIRPRFGTALHPGTPISGVDLVSEAEQAIAH